MGHKPNDQYPWKRKEGKDFPSGHCREPGVQPLLREVSQAMLCSQREREKEKGGKDERQRGGEDGHVKTEAETGMVLPQAEDHRRPLGPGKGKDGLSLEPLQCVYPAATLSLDFWAPEQGEDHFLLFKATKFVEIGSGSPRI